MDDLVHEVRSKQWAEIVVACNTSGQSKACWCKENGVSLRRFYYWQKKLRNEIYEAKQKSERTGMILHEGNGSKPMFAELATVSTGSVSGSGFHADAVIRVGSVTMEISNTASSLLLENLGRVIRSAVQCNGI